MQGFARARSACAAAAHPRHHLLDLGENAGDDHIDAGGSRVQPVALDELLVVQDSRQEERIKQEVAARGQIRKDPIERTDVVRSQIGGRQHPAQEHLDVPLIEAAQDVLQRLAGHQRIEAAEHVIGAELEDDGFGPLGHRPVEAREPSRSDTKDLRTDSIQDTSMHDTSMHDTSGLRDLGSRTSSAITLTGINLSLGRGATRVHILKDVNLDIGTGEAVGLVGPSGSGKSTLLMIMAGLERPDAGAVRGAGEDLGTLREDALARFRGRNVGIVFQSFHLLPTMTALENVAIPLELAGAADAAERAAAELAAVGLANRRAHYPAELSGREQQPVALARARAPNPAILIADEPTGNLDEATRSEIVDLLFASPSAPR